MESVDGLKIINRQKALLDWLHKDCGLSSISLLPIEGAASFRRYFRIHAHDTSLVVMDAPPSLENCQSYIHIANTLRKMQLNTPEIYAADVSLGFMLITDFGDMTYLKALNDQNVDSLYSQALSSLIVLQSCKEVEGHSIPTFDSHFMRQEWAWHKEWFANKLLGLTPLSNEKELDVCFELLVTSALNQPQVFMHRDFHSANLMVLPKHDVGILDFQDAFIGPVTYDLVSLLRDCYINWPEERVKKWVNQYRQQLHECHVLQDISEELFMQWFDWMSIERHLKALFTFARKKVRDSQPHYLAHIPRTLSYLINTTKEYPALAPMHEYLSDRVMPTFTRVNSSCEQ